MTEIEQMISKDQKDGPHLSDLGETDASVALSAETGKRSLERRAESQLDRSRLRERTP